MDIIKMDRRSIPYITPNKLLGDKCLPLDCKLAFICYCPMPIGFNKFKINIKLNDRYFVHIHNSHIDFCQYNNINFIVIAEVYGGPVSATTVEELKYYGIETIIGIGFVCSLKQSLSPGTLIVADNTLNESDTIPHYLDKQATNGKVSGTNNSNRENDLYVKPAIIFNEERTDSIFQSVCVWTTNALYREYKDDVIYALEMGCSVVNIDTSHLYAVCNCLNIRCRYYAVVSDVIVEDTNDTWTNDLTKALNDDNSNVIISQSNMILHLLDKLMMSETV